MTLEVLRVVSGWLHADVLEQDWWYVRDQYDDLVRLYGEKK